MEQYQIKSVEDTKPNIKRSSEKCLKQSTSFMKGLQLVQENAFAGSCSIFGVEPVCVSHFGILKLLEKFNITQLVSDATGKSTRRDVYERKALDKV